jgi:multiple sugar transport system permease protein
MGWAKAHPFFFTWKGDEKLKKTGTKKNVSYAKWGYFFIIPFFAAFLIFQLIPLVSTIYYSFFEYYRDGLSIVGPNFVGLNNYKQLLHSDFLKYMGNTVILWLMGFVPQIVVSLLLAAWFTDLRLKIHCKQFFKVVIYMPNLIMASAFAMLFFALFSDNGPINAFLTSCGLTSSPIRFLSSVLGARGLVALMNFLMWFGNTTILLMAAVMGISPSLFEAAELDGCNHRQIFFKITLPMIRPILVYVLITSMIGGLQMFDVPQILTNGKGSPNRTVTTVIMYLNNHLYSKNYGMAGAISFVLFLICAVLCICVYFSLNREDNDVKKEKKKLFSIKKKQVRKGEVENATSQLKMS